MMSFAGSPPLLMLLAIAAWAHGAGSDPPQKPPLFEGRLEYVETVPGERAAGAEARRNAHRRSFTLFASRAAARLERRSDSRGAQSYTVLVAEGAPGSSVRALDPARRTYVTVPGGLPMLMAEGGRIERSGSAEVAGIRCERVSLTRGPAGRLDACIAAALGDGPARRLFLLEVEGRYPWLESQLMRTGLTGVPVRLRVIDARGAPVYTLELTSSTAEAVPASAGRVPEGYRLDDQLRELLDSMGELEALDPAPDPAAPGATPSEAGR